MKDLPERLSSRLRPGVECAPWVVDAVKALEAERDALKELLRVADANPLDGLNRERIKAAVAAKGG